MKNGDKIDRAKILTNTNEGLGKIVKAYRLSREMTQDQAAAHFRISIRTYTRIEAGEGCGDLTRAKISKVIGPEALEVSQ